MIPSPPLPTVHAKSSSTLGGRREKLHPWGLYGRPHPVCVGLVGRCCGGESIVVEASAVCGGGGVMEEEEGVRTG